MNEVRKTLKTSLIYSFSDKYVGLALRLLSSIVLARLLTPNEIGLFSVSFVLVMLAHGLRDFGISQYIIQQKALTHVQLRMAFTLGLLFSWMIWLGLYFGATWISSFFSEKNMVSTIRTLSILFLLVPFGAVRVAILKRKMNFKALTGINVLSYLTLHLSCIFLAWKGWGVSALVWGNVVGILATVLGAQWCTRDVPLLYPTLQGARVLLNFGIKVSASQIIENLSEGIPEILIGKNWGMMNVGFFSRAQGCVNLFKTAVTQGLLPVTLPYFSEQYRAGHALGNEYLRWLNRYTLIAWPFFMSLNVLAEPVVLMLFGENWRSSIILVKILCWVALIESCLPFYQSMMIAAEKINFYFNYQMLHAGIRLLILLCAIPHGIQAICMGLVIAEFITSAILLYRFSHVFNFTLIAWSKSLLPGVMVAIGIAIMLRVTFYFGLSTQTVWIQLFVSVVIGLFLWLVTAICCRRFIVCHDA